MRGLLVLVSFIVFSVASWGSTAPHCALIAFEHMRALTESKSRVVEVRSSFKSKNNVKALFDRMIAKFSLQSSYNYRFNVGNNKTQSVYEHTMNTVNVFFEQYSYHEKIFKRLEERVGISVRRSLLSALLVHDVGKAYAYEQGDGKLQDKYNDPLIRPLLNSFKSLNSLEKKIAKSIVSRSHIGEFLQGKESLSDFQFRIKFEARLLGLTDKEYLSLARLFFISDAGSYDLLVYDKKVFYYTPGGVLKIRSQEWKDLQKNIHLL